MFLPYNLVELHFCLISTCFEIKHKCLPPGVLSLGRSWEVGISLYLLLWKHRWQLMKPRPYFHKAGYAHWIPLSPALQPQAPRPCSIHMSGIFCSGCLLHRKGKLGGLQTNLGKLRAYCSLTCYLMPAIYTKLSHTHPNSQFSPWASLKTYVERKINTQSLLNLYQMWFYSTDKHFSTAALVEHHMAKTGVCFSRLFFFSFFKPY